MDLQFENSALRRFVFAGGPGAGKTTVIDALRQRGLHCLPDVARAIIRARLSSGLSARPEPLEFARAIFEGDVANYGAAPSDRTCFFDRGVVDALGMLLQCGAMSGDEIESNLRRYPYNPLVFVFPPWQAIYHTDSERDQTFAEAVRVFESVKSWYGRCGYQVEEVPIGTLDARIAFIERAVADASPR
jgi:predicted ATPase